MASSSIGAAAVAIPRNTRVGLELGCVVLMAMLLPYTLAATFAAVLQAPTPVGASWAAVASNWSEDQVRALRQVYNLGGAHLLASAGVGSFG